MPFSQKQLEYFANADRRWNIKVGATRSGKTYADYFVIPKRIRNRIGKSGLAVILGVSQSTIESNILAPMREIWGDSLVGDINSKNTCRMFGETVYCLGAEKKSQVSKIRGKSIKYCYGDEIAEWSPDVFEMLKSRLDKPYSTFDGALNPESPNHWLKKFLDSDADIYNQHYTIFDNPFLEKDFVDELCLEYEGTVYYQRYILGEWALAEGLIYPNYQKLYENIPAPKKPDEKYESYVLSVDYGTMNAFAALLWAKFKGIWIAVDGYYYSGRDKGIQLTDREYGDKIDEKFGKYSNEWVKMPVIVDPSATSFITELKGRRKYKVIAADNDVRNGISETSSAIQAGLIKVSPDIKEFRNEIQGYAWDNSSSEEKPLKINDHYMDSMRYFVKTMQIMKNKYKWTNRNIMI